MSALVDLSLCCDHHASDALEMLYKSTTEPPDGGAWEPHESPFISRLIELFTERGLLRLDRVRDELQAWLEGARHDPSATQPIQRPEGMMGRWTQAELDLARLYLTTLPKERFDLGDWMLVVDYLVQRYLPMNDMRSEAEWFAVRSTMMGRVQANMESLTAKQADKVIAALPSTIGEAASAFRLTPEQRAIMEFGRERCAENIVSLTDDLRHRMRKRIMDYQFAQFTGDRAITAESLQTKLLDDFGLLNRDWRRIAVTEAGENANQGLIASLPVGTKVRRVEQYKHACGHCVKIDGKVMTVVSPTKEPKDGDTEVWVGKNNIGRSASPRKKVGGELVEREPHEMWWIAAGVQHPHCRGRWVVQQNPDAAGDSAFSAWLATTLRG